MRPSVIALVTASLSCIQAFAQADTVRVSAQSASGALGSTISVKVENLSSLLKTANNKPVLFLNGQEIKGIVGIAQQTTAPGEQGTLLFRLEVTPQNRDTWKPVLSQATLDPAHLLLSVGVSGQPAERSDFADFQLTILRKNYLIAWTAFVVVIVGGLVVLAYKSNVLREVGPVPAGKKAAFSLGRSQMAFWFVLIVAAYLFLFMVTGMYDTITAGTLGLMGISAGTALAGAAVDSSKNSAMEAERAQLQAEMAATPAPSPARQAVISSRLQEIAKQLETPRADKFFLIDLLTDGSGISLHRFQIFVWTIVLGVVFGVSVYRDLVMADFSPTLLGLMGISSGAYIGFKFPENKN